MDGQKEKNKNMQIYHENIFHRGCLLLRTAQFIKKEECNICLQANFRGVFLTDDALMVWNWKKVKKKKESGLVWSWWC